MDSLGKIFIYEQTQWHNVSYADYLEPLGFMVFSTNNLYQLLKYAPEIKPDIVIFDFPQHFNADLHTWQSINSVLCQYQCPQIYLTVIPPTWLIENTRAIKRKTSVMSKKQIINTLLQSKFTE